MAGIYTAKIIDLDLYTLPSIIIYRREAFSSQVESPNTVYFIAIIDNFFTKNKLKPFPSQLYINPHTAIK
jgi:hypothetical protein